MTPFMLREFADRVCAGTGQDRALERDICRALSYQTVERAPSIKHFGYIDEPSVDVYAKAIVYTEPPITDSLDAVEKMRKRFLPESMTMAQQYLDCFIAAIWEPGDFSHDMFQAHAPTECRARLAALLRELAFKKDRQS